MEAAEEFRHIDAQGVGQREDLVQRDVVLPVLDVHVEGPIDPRLRSDAGLRTARVDAKLP
ncbi:hypothetical protein AQJ91_14420 [Streptomyces dysideae]|uniref:Uncharacterized protein n=1 Tax=Streptomyces dysideae TaxID=909626 RepID=A0A101V0Z6_9ACTN|nr:hypothetical protein AQJ91_14420 [Streptomyces dysideae]